MEHGHIWSWTSGSGLGEGQPASETVLDLLAEKMSPPRCVLLTASGALTCVDLQTVRARHQSQTVKKVRWRSRRDGLRKLLWLLSWMYVCKQTDQSSFRLYVIDSLEWLDRRPNLMWPKLSSCVYELLYCSSTFYGRNLRLWSYFNLIIKE